MASFGANPSNMVALPMYSIADKQATTVLRVDLPMDNTFPESRASAPHGRDRIHMPIRGHDLPPATANITRRKQRTSSNHGGGHNTTSSTSLRFFVVDNPDKLKDKHQMRENRKHVMNDYLSKERRKPGSTDVRVTGGANPHRKRKRQEPRLNEQSVNPSAPSIIFKPDSVSDSSRSSKSPPAASQIAVISNGTQHSANAPEHVNPASDLPQMAPRSMIRFAEDEAPLVRGISGGFNNSPYLRTVADDVPSPVPSPARLGSSLNPFNTWPTLSDPLLNVEQLKWSCSRKFGSRGIVAHWVPTLLKAKHAFLSTICISSSHDEIMMKGVQASHERHRYGSTDGIKVRTEVISMINDALADPKQQAADVTIVSVLHLLNSEIMGCDDQTMTIHQQGLHQMIRKRGGLDCLGIDGELAMISTITMYLISALRETEPHADFVSYAAQNCTKPGNDSRQLPESPVYCRMPGYHTIKRSISVEHPTHKLLESLRLLTNSYVRRSGASSISPLTPIHVNASWDQSMNSVLAHKDNVYATKPANDRPEDFKNASDKHQFEALRLVGLVYAHALANDIPFSKAATELGSATASSCPEKQHTYPSPIPNTNPTFTSWHTLIKCSLARTNLSDCWGHMAGVLFWTTIVASACASPDPTSTSQSEEDEEARKWLAAVAVRCSIVLSFEHGGPMLETLKRIVGIEKSLAKANAERMGREVVWSVMSGSGVEGTYFGPEMEGVRRGTFSDFARDFMGSGG
ncbi:hypothetical protein DOTSEDRAFT_69051 [Dothistroma septosporum NZE10]|uniref:Tachykinin family protein n=1 Tax=Dothistroma septosporum (strain NZE10 / CBS 128990) TaxID=675120 RepID=N1Q5D7_DOTSN|nr:hypothetical protein DOTSEDRAFT_69051 [Dothistroma septosporum NZE10]